MNWLSRLLAPVPTRVAPVTREHADRLAEIHAAAFARPWAADEFDAMLLDRAVRVDGLFCGRSRLPDGFVVSRLVGDEAEILSVALAKSARSRGLSRDLLARHLLTLEHSGIRRVHLEVEDGNLPAIALYRRLGFSQSGTRPGYYARPDGTRAAALSMTRHLGSQPA